MLCIKGRGQFISSGCRYLHCRQRRRRMLLILLLMFCLIIFFPTISTNISVDGFVVHEHVQVVRRLSGPSSSIRQKVPSSLSISSLHDFFFSITDSKKRSSARTKNKNSRHINGDGNFTRDGKNQTRNNQNHTGTSLHEDGIDDDYDVSSINKTSITTNRTKATNDDNNNKNNISSVSETTRKVSSLNGMFPKVKTKAGSSKRATVNGGGNNKNITVANTTSTATTTNKTKNNLSFSNSIKLAFNKEENMDPSSGWSVGGSGTGIVFPFSTTTSTPSNKTKNFTGYQALKYTQGPSYLRNYKLPDLGKTFGDGGSAFNDAISNVTTLTTNTIYNMSTLTANQYNSLLQQAAAAAAAVAGDTTGAGRPLPAPPATTIQPINLTALLSSKSSQDDTITVADMEEILNEYTTRLQAAAVVEASLRQQQQQQQQLLQQFFTDNIRNNIASSSSSNSNKKQTGKNKVGYVDDDDNIDKMDAVSGVTGASSVQRRTKSGVAFPQPSVLNYNTLRKTTAAAGSFFGMLFSVTILPNLWLVGLILGGIYGYDVVTKLEESAASGSVDGGDDVKRPNRIARFVLACGRKLAKLWLTYYDHWQTIWFLYKTGQLSYEYYKVYEGLDQRFQIQSKMDAWNARFQQGKIDFDAWEKENEIGRTVLAGLRTVWLVDEQSKRRTKESSRYRVVQYLYEVKFYIGRGWRNLKAFLKSIANRSWYQEFWKGVKTDLKESGWDALGTRIGAVVAALIAVNITGALFAISPAFLIVAAACVGIVWPSWIAELFLRIQSLVDETRARGRGGAGIGSSSSSSGRMRTPLNTAKLLGRYDKTKYHYFKRPDGSKRYYRTGQSVFKRKEPQQDDGNKINALFPWLNKSSKKSKRRESNTNENWGLLSRFQGNNK